MDVLCDRIKCKRIFEMWKKGKYICKMEGKMGRLFMYDITINEGRDGKWIHKWVNGKKEREHCRL